MNVAAQLPTTLRATPVPPVVAFIQAKQFSSRTSHESSMRIPSRLADPPELTPRNLVNRLVTSKLAAVAVLSDLMYSPPAQDWILVLSICPPCSVTEAVPKALIA